MLDRIINTQKTTVAFLKSQMSLNDILCNVVPSDRSFYQAVKNKPSYILECKKASPSKGIINPNYHIPELVSHYEPFASAISVLTNAPFFKGTFKI